MYSSTPGRAVPSSLDGSDSPVLGKSAGGAGDERAALTAPAPAGGGGPLGNNTKYVAVSAGEADAGALARLAKYELQSVSRSLLPEDRVRFCLVCRLPHEEAVRVLYSPAKRSSYLGGLIVCGSLWICPVCASKISERRRRELEQALKVYRSIGGAVYLGTFTFAHERPDELRDILGRFLAAFRTMRQSRSYWRLSDHYRLQGTVKALEVTWGAEHGWHPHAHVLLFLHSEVDRGAFEEEFYRVWSAAAARRGLSMDREHGLKVQRTTDAVDKYVAKYGRAWGAADELVKAHSKRGRGERYTPFDLLRWLRDTGEALPAALFREYAAVFKGRRQLVWSDGLRVLLQLGRDRSDEQLAEEVEEDAVLLALLTPVQWLAVRYFNQRGELLEVARSGDGSRVGLFVSELVERLRGGDGARR